MDNYLLMKKSSDLVDFSSFLGFEKTLFLDSDFVVIKSKSKKDLLKEIKEAKKKTMVYVAKTEEMLRFALEKTDIDMVMGMEGIHPKDSVHFVRGGLDQVACKIAAERGKTIAFSFANILHAKDVMKLLARMTFNVKLCKKYKVKMLFSSFAQSRGEMRSRKDLESFARVLGI